MFWEPAGPKVATTACKKTGRAKMVVASDGALTEDEFGDCGAEGRNNRAYGDWQVEDDSHSDGALIEDILRLAGPKAATAVRKEAARAKVAVTGDGAHIGDDMGLAGTKAATTASTLSHSGCHGLVRSTCQGFGVF